MPERLQDLCTAKAIAADLEAIRSAYFLIQEQAEEIEREIRFRDLAQLEEGEPMPKNYRNKVNQLEKTSKRL